ncbi:MAG: DUF2024 family protein [Flavobacteriaceae bacterium]|nr:DUF2024 family protein [Flavobacteriaceae bacterium]
MKISVYDTYVPKEDKTVMHFDILVEEGTSEKNVYEYGKLYLDSKNLINNKLTTSECKFCHIEVAPEDVQNEICEKGFSIIEMENCE